ncbi:hypothetical protein VP01_4865g2 [Puccinia sorghi]|uniref:Uncharacterized protein n=1 Tax=Puccinia sorghi TaxID=27349 RepID=A0A0L6UN23_9BASI|nr:hypothetical protein VP01_4865g2 [Puccinia sorghi]
MHESGWNKKPCGISHWMSIQTTGHLLVELYNRPVFYFSISWIKSFLPSSPAPMASSNKHLAFCCIEDGG